MINYISRYNDAVVGKNIERLFLADDWKPAYKDPKVKVKVIKQTPQNLIHHKDTSINKFKNADLSNFGE